MSFRKVQGKLMEGIMHGDCIQYAVIEAVYGGRSERFGGGYAARKSLTALIAQSRIVASALKSRSEAEEFALAFFVSSPASWAGIALHIRTKTRRLSQAIHCIFRQLAFAADSLRTTVN